MKKRNSLSFKLRKEIYDQAGGLCRACGAKTTLFKPKVFGQIASAIDHIFPFSKGGKNNKNNLQLLCIYCNAKKFDQVDWKTK